MLATRRSEIRLTHMEQQVQRAGALAALALAAMALLGLVQGLRQPKGRVVGRTFQSVPLPVYIATTVVYVPTVVWLWRPLPIHLTRRVRAVAMVVGTVAYAGGVALTFWGRATLGRMYNVSTTQGAELYAEHRLVTSGPFAFVRHPMYVGALIGMVGAVLVYRTWALLFILLHVPVFWVRARREEDVLAAEFGAAWAEYCRRVPAGVPLPHFWPGRRSGTAQHCA